MAIMFSFLSILFLLTFLHVCLSHCDKKEKSEIKSKPTNNNKVHKRSIYYEYLLSNLDVYFLIFGLLFSDCIEL